MGIAILKGNGNKIYDFALKLKWGCDTTPLNLVLALSDNDKATTARLYCDDGYKAMTHDEAEPYDALLHHFASSSMGSTCYR